MSQNDSNKPKYDKNAIQQNFERWAKQRTPEQVLMQDMVWFFRERARAAGCSQQTIEDLDQALEKVMWEGLEKDGDVA